MRLILYGTEKDKSELERALTLVPKLCYRKVRIEDYTDYDSFIAGLGISPPDCVVIAIDGANGMEGVIAAKNSCRSVPVLWLSDDGGFGAQAYRLGCAYFHKKPLPPETLSAVIAKCV